MTHREFNIKLPDIPARSSVEIETTTRVLSDGSELPPIVERWTSRCLDCGRIILADGRCGCFWRTRDQWLARHVRPFGLVVTWMNVALAIFGLIQLATGFQLNPDRIVECQLLVVLNLAGGMYCIHGTILLRRARRDP